MTTEFEFLYNSLLMDLKYRGSRVPMNTWQSQVVDTRPGMGYSIELRHRSIQLKLPQTMQELQALVKPNLPWAEDHFLERISGNPYNPPPSEQWWPFAVAGNAEHKADEKFSHTYPERIWPKYAGDNSGDRYTGLMNVGIRYHYGDLWDVVNLLENDPLTRQAYLPIWFPEDTGSVLGQRVPCTLGYHFLFRPASPLLAPGKDAELRGEIVYHIRSCDIFRHFTDDVYMAGRLLQWVVGMLRERGINAIASSLIMHIASLHAFEGDEDRLTYLTKKIFDEEEPVYGSPV